LLKIIRVSRTKTSVSKTVALFLSSSQY
jgi:hypothetical protein